jgi:uncharacterized protein YegL
MDPLRRLPVYLLLDCSGSMTGEPIEAVRQGVRALVADLRTDPQALETAYLSVITFDSTAQQVCPLTELMSFQEPNIEANGTTSMGGALRLLEQCLDTEVRKSTATQKGDWKPLIFIMTDGQPTDSWHDVADRLKSRRPGNIIGCAAGPGADVSPLKQITEIVVRLDSLQPDTLKAFFKWVSSSIRATSQSVAQAAAAGAQGPVNLPNPPAGIQIVP